MCQTSSLPGMLLLSSSKGSQWEAILLPMGHLVTSRDILIIATWWRGCAPGTQMEEVRKPTEHLQCTGQPTAKRYPNADCAQAENF